MSVFVYPLPLRLTGESLYDNITADDHDFHFRGELELTQRLRELPQADPNTADMLLVPFMLVQAFTKLRKGFRSPGHARLMRWDAEVVAWLRSYGPYYDSRRANHAVFAQRCAGPPFDRLRKASIAVNTWPTLWDSNATLLCFEPATLSHMGRGILLPYGVGHGSGGLRCPGTAGSAASASSVVETRAGRALIEEEGAKAALLAGGLGVAPGAIASTGGVFDRMTIPPRPRANLLMFAGSTATNPARQAWVHAMVAVGEPTCHLQVFGKSNRKHFSAARLEDSLQQASFTLQLKGHVGPRKAMFDSIRCGALLVVAGDRSPFPFADQLRYSDFGVQVPEAANATRVIAALQRQFDERRIAQMRSAMLQAAVWLDYSPRGKLAEAVLSRFRRVAGREIAAVPSSTRTPLTRLRL
jgi:hypothetical protein